MPVATYVVKRLFGVDTAIALARGSSKERRWAGLEWSLAMAEAVNTLNSTLSYGDMLSQLQKTLISHSRVLRSIVLGDITAAAVLRSKAGTEILRVHAHLPRIREDLARIGPGSVSSPVLEFRRVTMAALDRRLSGGLEREIAIRWMARRRTWSEHRQISKAEAYLTTLGLIGENSHFALDFGWLATSPELDRAVRMARKETWAASLVGKIALWKETTHRHRDLNAAFGRITFDDKADQRQMAEYVATSVKASIRMDDPGLPPGFGSATSEAGMYQPVRILSYSFAWRVQTPSERRDRWYEPFVPVTFHVESVGTPVMPRSEWLRPRGEGSSRPSQNPAKERLARFAEQNLVGKEATLSSIRQAGLDLWDRPLFEARATIDGWPGREWTAEIWGHEQAKEGSLARIEAVRGLRLICRVHGP